MTIFASHLFFLKKTLLLFLFFSALIQAQTITTIAGNGTIGRTGDGGQGNQAQIFYPYGITTDRLGNIYIADDYNYCIRKINTKGIIANIAGIPVTGYGGDNAPAINAQFAEVTGVAVDGPGNVYIADNG